MRRLIYLLFSLTLIVLFTACDDVSLDEECIKLSRELEKLFLKQKEEAQKWLDLMGEVKDLAKRIGGGGIVDNTSDAKDNAEDIDENLRNRFGKDPAEVAYHRRHMSSLGLPTYKEPFGDDGWEWTFSRMVDFDVFGYLSFGIQGTKTPEGEGRELPALTEEEQARDFMNKYLRSKFRDDYSVLGASSVLMAASDVAETRRHASQISDNVESIMNEKYSESVSTQRTMVELDAEGLASRSKLAQIYSSRLALRIQKMLRSLEFDALLSIDKEYSRAALESQLKSEFKDIAKFKDQTRAR